MLHAAVCLTFLSSPAAAWLFPSLHPYSHHWDPHAHTFVPAPVCTLTGFVTHLSRSPVSAFFSPVALVSFPLPFAASLPSSGTCPPPSSTHSPASTSRLPPPVPALFPPVPHGSRLQVLVEALGTSLPLSPRNITLLWFCKEHGQKYLRPLYFSLLYKHQSSS